MVMMRFVMVMRTKGVFCGPTIIQNFVDKVVVQKGFKGSIDRYSIKVLFERFFQISV